MNQSMITLQGYLGADPMLRRAGGHAVANFRVAVTPRRLDRATGKWVDLPTQWYTVNAWRQLGENVARSLRKGDPVVVHGRLMARSYVNRDQIEVNTFEIEAAVVGHDLNRGVSTIAKTPPARRPDELGTAPGERSESSALSPGQDVGPIERARDDWSDSAFQPMRAGERRESEPEVATTAA